MNKTPKKPGKIDPKSNTKPTNQDNSLLKCSQLDAKVCESTHHEGYLSTRQPPENMPDIKSRAKKKMGRPTKYKPIYCEAIISFFNREHTYEAKVTHTNRKGESWTSYETRANPVPLMIDFADYIGVHTDTLKDWSNNFEDFLRAYSHAQEAQLRHLATVTGLGLYNSNWAVFMAKNISTWRDKKDIEHSGELGFSLLTEGLAGKAEQARRERASVLN